ncbi:unannotated protein [freshwater metagenome]|uniref:Unannotated protein n=1 Tax=freshwater metagenome TaxID=449393 RepID=A0A6J6HBP1_9ZZZZ
MELPEGSDVGIVIVYTKLVSILNSVVQVVANEPDPYLVDETGNEVDALLSFEVKGKLQFCFGGFTGAQGAVGLDTLCNRQSPTWREISSMRFSK